MDIYQFLENADVYLQPTVGTDTYKLDVTPEGISFSQTFTEHTYAQKTLHTLSHHVKSGSISKANPADFAFTIPLLKESDFDTVFNLLVDLNTEHTLNTFNLFFIIDAVVYSIEDCVLLSGNFTTSNSAPISLQLTGQGTKLSINSLASATAINGGKIVDSLGNISAAFSALSTIPTFTTANVVARSATRSFLPLTDHYFGTSYSATGHDRSEHAASINMELQNAVSWTGYQTVHKALTEVDAVEPGTNVQYPSGFSLSNRNIAGSVTYYATAPVLTYSQGATLQVILYSRIGSANYGIKLEAPINFTSRVSPGSVVTNQYDWRLASNADTFTNYLTYTTA